MQKDMYDMYIFPHLFLSLLVYSTIMLILIGFLFNIAPNLFIFIGPAFGVIFGFILKDYSYELYKDNKRRKFYLNLLNENVDEIIKRLPEEGADLVSEDVWATCINSGDLKLFSYSQASDLYKTFFYVKVHNYIAVRFSNNQVAREHLMINNQFLLEKLKDLKNKNWFKIERGD